MCWDATAVDEWELWKDKYINFEIFLLYVLHKVQKEAKVYIFQL